MKKVLAAAAAVIFLPVVAFAQARDLEDSVSGLSGFVEELTDVVNSLIPFFLAIAVVYFIWGVIKYIISASPDDAAKGRSIIIWGIVGIAVIVSLFGLIRLLQSTFGVDGGPLDSGGLPTIENR